MEKHINAGEEEKRGTKKPRTLSELNTRIALATSLAVHTAAREYANPSITYT